MTTVNDNAPGSIDPFEDFEPVTTYVVPEEAVPVLRRRRRRRPWTIVSSVVFMVAIAAGGFVAGRMTADLKSSPSPTSQWASDEDRLLAVALALHQQGDLAAAEQAYNSLLTMNPDNQYAHYNLGVIRQGEGKLEEAVAFYDTAISLDPELLSARYNRGLALRDLGRADEALADLQFVVDREPQNAVALYNLGNLMIAQGDTDAGTDLVMQAVEIDPSLRGD